MCRIAKISLVVLLLNLAIGTAAAVALRFVTNRMPEEELRDDPRDPV